MSDSRSGDRTDLGLSELLPTGTVTMLLVATEEPNRLRQADSEGAAGVAGPDRTLANVITAHGGVQPAQQAESDTFLAAFARASDAVACALDLQLAPPAPVRLRIGIHTGEVQLRNDAVYIGPTVERAAQLRDLAHAGQIVLSGLTEKLVAERLPADAWLTALDAHPLRGAPHRRRVVQLCHPQLSNEFSPHRISETVVGSGPPAPLTTFVGRAAELTEVQKLVCEHRLVTLTGAGGVGKTRLAARLVDQLAGGFNNEVWWVDLASLSDPDLVAISVARALGLPDQPGRSTTAALVRLIADRRTLLVLDNCEHLLDPCAALVAALLSACPRLQILATSREPIGVVGEMSWRTPSLALADEAIELFTDRARLVWPDFTISDDNTAAVSEICRRLDGMPLAIELAAAHVRAMSLDEISVGLRDRFRLLTGATRFAVARQQTLRASVDWSHALLSERERVLLRRLAVFPGDFDLDAAHSIGGGTDVPHYQILDELSLLVDKSLVVADDTGRATRYRLLETVRQYGLEKLSDSGEADAVRTRHRDYYAGWAAHLAASTSLTHQQRVERAEIEFDNLRSAFAWSLDNADVGFAEQLASSLQPLWLRGRILEGLNWFDAVLGRDPAAASAADARALADRTILDGISGNFGGLNQAEPALAIARELGEPALLARVLTACGANFAFSPQVAVPCLQEAIELSRALGDDWQLSQTLGWRAFTAHVAGDPMTACAAAEEGRDLADGIGDKFISRMCRWYLGLARWLRADLVGAAAQFSDVTSQSQIAYDSLWRGYNLFSLGKTLACQGDTDGARAAAEAAIANAADTTAIQQALSFAALADAALAAGDVATAASASNEAWQTCPQIGLVAVNAYPMAQAALAEGDVSAARRWVDDAISVASGGHRMILLATRVRVGIAQGDLRQAERDAHAALAIAMQTEAYLTIPDVIECLATLAAKSGGRQEAARLFGAAATIRDRTGQVRFKVYDDDYNLAIASLRKALHDSDFDAAWSEGAARSSAEAIAYALRGHGPRSRPANGWASLTPAELDVIRLVGEGLGNKDIGVKLFMSPRTVQTHLAHVYTKLGVSSRVQLTQEADRHRQSGSIRSGRAR